MKKFTITITADDNQLHIDSTNDGFSTLELIGVLELKLDDIKRQAQSHAYFKRTLVSCKDGNTYDIKED